MRHQEIPTLTGSHRISCVDKHMTSLAFKTETMNKTGALNSLHNVVIVVRLSTPLILRNAVRQNFLAVSCMASGKFQK